MPRTTATVNKTAQIKATTAAKRAKVKEAGLEGRRAGSASATTRAVQGKRDAKAKAVVMPADKAKDEVTTSPKKATNGAVKKPAKVSKAAQGRAATLIEVRTGNSVKGDARLNAYAEEVVTEGLSRFLPRVTRIEVHFTDENADKKGDNDKHCQIEVRPASQQPVSAKANAATIEKALSTAVSKMKRLLAKRLDQRVRA